jgi:hypothetical protein
MLNFVFLAGLLISVVSSAYFYVSSENKEGFNTAFLVSFITLTSYVLIDKIIGPTDVMGEVRWYT